VSAVPVGDAVPVGGAVPKDERHVVIVGGGIAGLVAARELALGGVVVTLLEASGSLGGKVASQEIAGIRVDSGAESFATRRGTVASLAVDLGLGDQVRAPNPAGAWLQRSHGHAVPMPKSGLLGIPGTPLAADVIAVVGLAGAFRAQLDSLLMLTGSKERTLGGLVRRRMGNRILDDLVAPVVLGVHSRHPDELDVDVVAPGLRKALLAKNSLAQAVLELRGAAPAGSAVNGIDGGIARLVETLAEKLPRLGVEVRLDSPVDDVRADRVTLRSGEVLEADRVIQACQLGGQGADTIVLATLVVDSPQLDDAPRGTGLLVAPGAHGILAKALTHATAKWPWLAATVGKGRHVIRLSYNADVAPQGLQEQARSDAEKLLGVPIPPASVVGFARVAWPAPPPALPVADGVIVIGESVAGVGLAAVVAQARQQSADLLRDFER
jgi:oxygen-dependent protoporphyrinogen oxidase